MAPSPANPAEFSFRTRRQHWERLKQNPEPIDIAIIGGGIVGAGLLRELALRGAKSVYLFEKNDFASGTSSVSSKLIHAGIRYLEQVWVHLKHGRVGQAWTNFVFVVGASRERKILGRIAPPLVRPKPIYFALSKSDPRSSLSVLSGVWLYYFIQLLQGQVFSPPIAAFSEKSIAKHVPELDARRVKAVFRFWDSETDDARLTIANLQSANALGGTALNYIELIEYERTGKGILLTLKDRETGEVATCTAKRLINATGPHLDDVRAREKKAPALRNKWIDRVAGSHIDIYPAIAEKSYYVSASDNRLVFALRRDEDGFVYTRVGTTERPLTAEESSDRPQPTSKELDYLQALVKEYFPNARINEKSILKSDSGIRPLRSQAGLDSFQKSREHDIINENGVFHIAGVKLTDFRRVAVEIAGLLGIPQRKNSARVPLVFSDTVAYPEKDIPDIVHRTMAVRWGDYLYRRLGALPFLMSKKEPAALRKEFDAFASVMGWNHERRELEWNNPR